MSTRRRTSMLWLVAGSALACGQFAFAQTTVNWGSGVNGSWGVSSNWSPAIVPDNNGPLTYNVNLPNYGVLYTVTLDTTRDVSNLNVTGTAQDTVLDLFGNDLAVAGNFNLTKGYIAGDGSGNKITVGGTATFNGGMYMWADLETNGNLVFGSTSDEEFCDTGVDHNGSAVTWSGTGDIHFFGGSTFNHGSGSTFNITHVGNNTFLGSGIDQFNNFGTIVKNGGSGTTTFQDIDFQNKGILKIQTGDVKFVTTSLIDDGELTEGTFEIADGAGMRVTNAQGQDEEIQTCNARVSLSGVGSRFVSLDSLQRISDKGQLRLESGRNFRSRGSFQNFGRIITASQAQFEFSAGALSSVNGGTIDAFDRGVVSVLAGASLQNEGLIRATSDGLISFLDGSNLLNITGDALVGGEFTAQGGGIIEGAQFDSVRRLESNVLVNGQLSDIRGSRGNSVLNDIRVIGASGSLEFNNRTVTLTNDLSIVAGNGLAGRLTVGDNAVLSFVNGARFTPLAGGEFDLGSLTVRGEVIADNLEIRSINSKVTIDRALGVIRNRTTGFDALASLERLGPRAEFTIALGRDLTTNGGLSAELGSVLRVGPADGQDRSRLNVGGVLNMNGVAVLAGGEISALQTVIGGYLIGNGFVAGEVVNFGTISPGLDLGSLSFAGDLRNVGPGTMEFQIGGTQRGITYDTIDVAGALEFIGQGGSSGLLRLELVDGFVPADGQRFLLISHGNRFGVGFAELDFLNGPAGSSFAISYEELGVFATFSVPAPGISSMLAVAGLFCSRRRR